MMEAGDEVEVWYESKWTKATVVQARTYQRTGMAVIATIGSGRTVYASGNEEKGYSFRPVHNQP